MSGAACTPVTVYVRRLRHLQLRRPDRCFRGHGGDPRAAACAGRGSVVRAYGPRPERDRWRVGAARVAMPVPQPAATRGLRVRYVRISGSSCVAARCTGPRRVRADRRGAAAQVWQFGHRKRLPPLHGPIRVYRPARGAYLLIFRMNGVAIGLETRKLGLARLNAIASSLTAVEL